MKDVVLPDASGSRPCWWLHVSPQIRMPLLTYLPASLVGCGLFHPAHAGLSFMARMHPENRKTLHHNEHNSIRYSNPDLCMGLRGSCRVLRTLSLPLQFPVTSIGSLQQTKLASGLWSKCNRHDVMRVLCSADAVRWAVGGIDSDSIWGVIVLGKCHMNMQRYWTLGHEWHHE